ncbi:alpha-galactosidase [Faecalibaculum rodentium]|uniref:Alpha-galactosidase n=1 Tax=Faecalibaculum rodentium TaxID=1702221 RepID=A0A140DYJ3_9FIRM|nr:alpha-galactosidase [Faecalibaculum rodentium]AMK55720.1 alpha-galactosidase [Faecalibaculum rodentium]
MAIQVIRDRIFQIETEHTCYQIQADRHNILSHLWYGPKTGGQVMDYLQDYPDVGFAGSIADAGNDRTYSLDTRLQEYPCEGTGDYRISAAGLEDSRGLDLRYEGYEILEGRPVLEGLPQIREAGNPLQTLVLHLADKVTEVTCDLFYVVDEENDAIIRSARFENRSGRPVWLDRTASLSLDVHHGEPVGLITFTGKHNKERQFTRRRLEQGIVSAGSTRGTSSHQQNPAVILTGPDTTETAGWAVGAMLVYSGSFRADAEMDQLGQTRLVMGINPYGFRWKLNPGESFQTPEAVLIRSDEGLEVLSLRFHRLIRQRLIPPRFRNRPRPVLINTWEAAYFNFDRKTILDIARQSADMDIDLLVLDDGWFGSRNSDNAGLGDWEVNEKKLEGSLQSLIEEVNAAGLDFGIWIEPEMVNEDSNLYRTHPDWVLKAPGRGPVRGRNQLVLDMTNPEVVDHLFQVFSKLLTDNHITYVKWDMNRSLADRHSDHLPEDRQGEVHHRYMLGVYDLLDRLTKAVPDVLFEGCSGGGGRFDAGMLYYTPQIWCSDDTDPHERTLIQYGTSFFYPPDTVGSHVSASPNHQTGRRTSLDTRAAAAMPGTFGYELDPETLDDLEREEIRGMNQLYRDLQPLIFHGRYYRLTNPGQGMALWQIADDDRVLVQGLVYETEPNALRRRVRLRGLDPKAVYRDADGMRRTGQALMTGGLLLPLTSGTDAPVTVILEREKTQ